MSRIIKCLVIIPAIVIFAVSCNPRNNGAITGSGTIEATEVLVSAKMAGSIMELWLQEGDAVQEGQLIAQIDSEKVFLTKKQVLAGLRELRLNLINAERSVRLAKDNLDNIEKKYQRIKTLLGEGSATQQQFDDAETGYKAADTHYQNAATSLESFKAKEMQILTQLELLDSQLRDAQVVAPLTGTLIEKYVEKGEVVRPGSPVANLADLQNMWIKIYVKETELAHTKLNGAAELRISAYPERVFPCQVSWISPKAEFTPKNVQTKEARSDLVYAVKIIIKNSDGMLKIGMPADVMLK